MNWLLSAYRDQRTWLTLGYLLFASLPMAVLSFVVTVTALTLGLSLLPLLGGIPLLVIGLRLVGVFAAAERSLASSLLDVPMPRQPEAPLPSSGRMFWGELSARVSRPRTWHELAFVFMSLPMSIINLTVGTGIVGAAFGGFSYPILHLAGVDHDMGSWRIDTLAESLIFIPASLLFLLIGPRLLLGWRPITASLPSWLLGRIDRSEFRRTIGLASSDHELDAPSVVIELERRFGPGPWLNPVNVQATLLGMEAAGTLQARPSDDGRTLYTSVTAPPNSTAGGSTAVW